MTSKLTENDDKSLLRLVQAELDKERRSLMVSWKRRQKLIDGVLQGIVGSSAIVHIDALELLDEFNDDEE